MPYRCWSLSKVARKRVGRDRSSDHQRVEDRPARRRPSPNKRLDHEIAAHFEDAHVLTLDEADQRVDDVALLDVLARPASR